MRTPLLAALLTTALGATAGACFSDSTECVAGSEDCQCVDLQCEAGLACMGGVCRVLDGTDSATSTSTTGTSTSSSASDSTSSTSSSSDATSTTDPTSTSSTSGTTGSTTDTGTTGGVSNCGNEILDPDEECDGVDGCTDDCKLEFWDCNPLTNVPCQAGTKCSYKEPMPGNPSFSCIPFFEPPPLQLHEGNCYNFEPLDEACDVGLACMTTNSAQACMDAQINCCVEFCDVLDPNFVCANPGDSCQSWWNGGQQPGLNNLGACYL